MAGVVSQCMAGVISQCMAGVLSQCMAGVVYNKFSTFKECKFVCYVGKRVRVVAKAEGEARGEGWS